MRPSRKKYTNLRNGGNIDYRWVSPDRMTVNRTVREVSFSPEYQHITQFESTSRCSSVAPTYRPVGKNPPDSLAKILLKKSKQMTFKDRLSRDLAHAMTHERKREAAIAKWNALCERVDTFIDRRNKRLLFWEQQALKYRGLVGSTFIMYQNYRVKYTAMRRSGEKLPLWQKKQRQEIFDAALLYKVNSIEPLLKDLREKKEKMKYAKHKYEKQINFIVRSNREHDFQMTWNILPKAREREAARLARIELDEYRVYLQAKEKAQKKLERYMAYIDYCKSVGVSPLSPQVWGDSSKDLDKRVAYPKYLTVTREDGSNVYLARTYTSRANPYTFKKWEIRRTSSMGLLSSQAIPPMVPLDAQGYDIDDLISKSIQKAYLGFEKGMRLNHATLGMNILLWTKTRDIIRGIEVCLTKIVAERHAIMAFDFVFKSQLSSAWFFSMMKEGASYMLMWKFAFLPLVRLVDDLRTTLTNLDDIDTSKEYTFSGTSLWSNSSQKSVTVNQDPPLDSIQAGSAVEWLMPYQGTKSTQTSQDDSVRVKVTLVVKPKSILEVIAAQIGMLTPMTAVWQVVPFSFVVDWLLQVAKFVEIYETANYTPAWTFVEGFVTITHRHERSVISTPANCWSWFRNPDAPAQDIGDYITYYTLKPNTNETSDFRIFKSLRRYKMAEMPTLPDVRVHNTFNRSKIASLLVIAVALTRVKYPPAKRKVIAAQYQKWQQTLTDKYQGKVLFNRSAKNNIKIKDRVDPNWDSGEY